MNNSTQANVIDLFRHQKENPLSPASCVEGAKSPPQAAAEVHASQPPTNVISMSASRAKKQQAIAVPDAVIPDVGFLSFWTMVFAPWINIWFGLGATAIGLMTVDFLTRDLWTHDMTFLMTAAGIMFLFYVFQAQKFEPTNPFHGNRVRVLGLFGKGSSEYEYTEILRNEKWTRKWRRSAQK